MLCKKEGFPHESELVLCTVKKILPNSIFCELDDYRSKEGLIHISEVAPGRIRNIRDYVVENKKVVCKVIGVDEKKGHIDLSLRRVTESLKAIKLNEHKQEEKAEKLLEQVAKRLNTSLEEVYQKAGNKIIESFGTLMGCYQKLVVSDEKPLIDLSIDKKIASEIVKMVKERIKPPEVRIESKIVLKNPSPDGVDRIKSILKKTLDLAQKNNYRIKLTYVGAPNYRLVITASDYKTAETIFQKISSLISDESKKEKGEYQVIR